MQEYVGLGQVASLSANNGNESEGSDGRNVGAVLLDLLCRYGHSNYVSIAYEQVYTVVSYLSIVLVYIVETAVMWCTALW